MKRMAFSIGYLLIMAVLAHADSGDSSGVFWIFFKDKGPDIETRLADYQKSLPNRTILRRMKALGTKPVVDFYDLPVYAPYKDAVQKYVYKMREESRWLNAISAEIAICKLDSISLLPFVDKIQPVARSGPQSLGYEIAESWVAGGSSYMLSNLGLDYGPSFRQLEQIGVVRVHEKGFHGEGVLICFLDTGFLTYHHAFDQMDIVAAYDFIHDDDFVGYDPSQDLPGQPDHGTGTLGTIGGYYPGQLIGPAFGASFILCKTEETGSETAVEEDYYVAGLEWGEMLGADVASSSLSYSDWYTIDDFDGQTCITTIAANIAFQKGLLLCSSMGNSGPGKFTLGAPADSKYSLGIGGVQWNDVLYAHSSWGPTADGRIKPDVCAQAVNTIAATPYTTDGFSKWSGTSLSCPLVAGVVALVIQAHPEWGPELVKEAIRESASRANHPDIEFGWGIVNAERAIAYPSFSGYIIDNKTKRGVATEIVLTGARDSQRFEGNSDGSGYFIFPNLPEGKYLLKAVDNKYEAYESTFTVPPSIEFDIYLEKNR